MTLNQKLLVELVPLIAKKLAAASAEAGGNDGSHYERWRARQRNAENKLMDFFTERYDARFSAKGDNHRVVMAGIRSTSTSGWTNAMHNWHRAAEQKIAASEPADDVINLQGSGPAPIEEREG